MKDAIFRITKFFKEICNINTETTGQMCMKISPEYHMYCLTTLHPCINLYFTDPCNLCVSKTWFTRNIPSTDISFWYSFRVIVKYEMLQVFDCRPSSLLKKRTHLMNIVISPNIAKLYLLVGFDGRLPLENKYFIRWEVAHFL